eukprot:GHVS01029759.1.p1 GENE.GHVS01029759.1~~GHVS01029759.1.p1  ORF type:complete len:267 (+),score=36.93 GHVS01029759.1:89-889(+)
MTTSSADTRRNQVLSTEKIEPTDPQIKEHYEQFKQDITKQALTILRDIIPKKIIHFNSLVSVSAHPGSVLHSTDLERLSYNFLPEGEIIPVDQEPNSKKQKLNSAAACRSGAVMYTHSIASHKQISAEIECTKAETAELIEMVGNVKLWIQLNVPRIEDGNNFGVGIQEDAISELARVEDTAFNLYDCICKYYIGRAKLTTKVLKYPGVQDYQEAVRELDEKEWIHLKIIKVDMRNNYSMLYDLLSKNWEKVVKPKNEHGASMMTF